MRLDRGGKRLSACRSRHSHLRRAILAAGLGFSLVVSPAGAQAGDRDGAALEQMALGGSPAMVPSFAPIVRKVLPATVSISISLRPGARLDDEDTDESDAGPGVMPGTSTLDEMLRRFFEEQPAPGRQRTVLGSGFVIDPAGYIVTGNHVVTNADKITITFQDNRERPAKVVGRDALTDLALLKVDADQPLPYAAWGDSDAAAVGDWVLAVGNSFGLGGTVSFGIVSARGRDLHSGPFDAFLQIDAAINRGNSGGPIFNIEGQVVGITTAIYTPSGGSVGIAFAIPANLAKPVIDQLRAHGKVIRGWIGVQLQEVTPAIAGSFGLAKAEGALVVDVVDGGPGARAGFRRGDVVLSYNGRSIETLRDLSILVADTPPGQQGAVVVWRKGHDVTLSPIIEEMPQPRSVALNDSGGRGDRAMETTASILGLTLAPLTPEGRQLFNVPNKVKGALVFSIADDSPFADLDIARGDVIVSIDQEPVSTPREAVAKLRTATRRREGSVPILLNRGGAGRFIALSTDDAKAARPNRRSPSQR